MQRYLGIDYGEKKIGLAIGIASWVKPHGIIPNSSGQKLETEAIKQISEIIVNEKISDVIIGCPVSIYSKNGNNKTDGFTNKLKEYLLKNFSDYNPNFHLVDESGSTKVVKESLKDLGIRKKQRKFDDAFAACEILERWIADNS